MSVEGKRKTWNADISPGKEAVLLVRTLTPAFVCTATRSSTVKGPPVTGQLPLSCQAAPSHHHLVLRMESSIDSNVPTQTCLPIPACIGNGKVLSRKA